MNAYSLGKIAAIIFRDVEELTPGCLGNLSVAQGSYATVLRHVWPRAMENPAIRGLAAEPGNVTTPASGGDQSTFWLGFYHQRHAHNLESEVDE